MHSMKGLGQSYNKIEPLAFLSQTLLQRGRRKFVHEKELVANNCAKVET